MSRLTANVTKVKKNRNYPHLFRMKEINFFCAGGINSVGIKGEPGIPGRPPIGGHRGREGPEGPRGDKGFRGSQVILKL